jgi:hypothetical protein
MGGFPQPVGVAAAIAVVLAVFAAPAAAVADSRYDALIALTAPTDKPKYDVVQSKNAWDADEQARAVEDGIFDISETPPGQVVLKPPLDWSQDPFQSDSWRGDLHSLKWLDLLFYVYRKSPDPATRIAALKAALDIALDWIAKNPPPAPYGPGVYTDNKPWGPKVAGDRVPYLAYLARALAYERPQQVNPDSLMNEAQGVALLDSIQTHVAFLSDPTESRANNQGLFMDIGLILVDNYFSEDIVPGSTAGGDLGRVRFPNSLIARTAVAEGMWLEHSSGYQRLATNLLGDYIDFTGINDPGLNSLFGRMRDATGWFVMPDGTQPQWGDSYIKDSPDWAKEAGADDFGMGVFPEAGYVFIKRPDTGSYLGITAGFHNGTHKHADDTSFDLYEGGRRVISDTGLFHKDDGGYRAFEQEAQAHNVLTEGREDFDLDQAIIYGSGVQATGSDFGWYLVLVANPLLESDDIRERRVFLYKPSVALIVLDMAKARQTEQFRRWFHVGPGIGVARRPGGRYALADSGFAGSIVDGDPDGSRKTFTASEHPFQGYNFPRFRETVPRTTVLLQSKRTRELNGVATISLGTAGYSAEYAGGKRPTIAVRAGKKKPVYLRVIRQGASLGVAEVKRPKPPDEPRRHGPHGHAGGSVRPGNG